MITLLVFSLSTAQGGGNVCVTVPSNKSQVNLVLEFDAMEGSKQVC